jgi:hypothetical protein
MTLPSGDLTQCHVASTAILSRHQPYPGREVAPRLEGAGVQLVEIGRGRSRSRNGAVGQSKKVQPLKMSMNSTQVRAVLRCEQIIADSSSISGDAKK